MTADSTGRLAGVLRDATQTLHAQVEQTGLFGALINGTIEPHQYCLLLRNLVPIYESLERGLRAHQLDPVIKCIYDDRLWRTHKIEQDLDDLYGEHWRQDLPLCAIACGYRQHLEAISADSSGLHRLVAHAYVRYLGDLSGGQLLRRTISRVFELPGSQGVAFYDFGSANQAESQASEFRNGLNTISLNNSKSAETVAEAVYAFEMHISLAQELAEIDPV